jgi:aryl-alcohol dehydrogenase-like predicted oxidoreductase
VTGSRLIFGAGSLHRLPLRSQRHRLLRRALDAGFRAFDVAPSYGNGVNELELGIVASRLDGIRITTKFGIPFDAYGERHPHLFPLLRAAHKLRRARYRSGSVRRDMSVAAMVASLEQSLRRLRTDCVDRFMIHEPLVPLGVGELDDLCARAERLRSEGKIRDFGIAGPASSIGAAASHSGIVVVQAPLGDILAAVVASSKPMIAFGVYRRFVAERGASFADFVRETQTRRPGLELILTSLSTAVVDSFADFHHG